MIEIYVITVGYDYEYDKPVGVAYDLDEAYRVAQREATKDYNAGYDPHSEENVNIVWTEPYDYNHGTVIRGEYPHKGSSEHVEITKVPLYENSLSV